MTGNKRGTSIHPVRQRHTFPLGLTKPTGPLNSRRTEICILTPWIRHKDILRCEVLVSWHDHARQLRRIKKRNTFASPNSMYARILKSRSEILRWSRKTDLGIQRSNFWTPKGPDFDRGILVSVVFSDLRNQTSTSGSELRPQDPEVEFGIIHQDPDIDLRILTSTSGSQPRQSRSNTRHCGS